MTPRRDNRQLVVKPTVLDRGRALGRALALDVLSARQKAQELFRAPTRGNLVHFIYLHGVEWKHQDRFKWLIEVLQRDYRFVSYSEAVSRLNEGRVEEQYACVSFDDGFESCIRAGSLLAEAGVQAAFFVCPGLIDRPRAALHEPFPGGLGGESRTMTWEEIEMLAALGHEIGSHTTTHRVVSGLGADEVLVELSESKRELESRFGPIEHFAWPRGRWEHFTPDAVRAAADAGYLSCASAVRGSHASLRGSNYPVIRREHVSLEWPERHIEYFLRRGRSGRYVSDGAWPSAWEVSNSSALGAEDV